MSHKNETVRVRHITTVESDALRRTLYCYFISGRGSIQHYIYVYLLLVVFRGLKTNNKNKCFGWETAIAVGLSYGFGITAVVGGRFAK